MTIGYSAHASFPHSFVDAQTAIIFARYLLDIYNKSTRRASTPDQLLDALLGFNATGGTNFTLAIQQAQVIMDQNWNAERSPIIIFLSGGDCIIEDNIIQDLCRTAIRLGKAVSFHSVSFGPRGASLYLRRMADIARDAQNNAPRDPLALTTAAVLSSYTQALDTVYDISGYMYTSRLVVASC
ncbi:hypothetical protein J3R82DRAFT_3399 [Butyriboletus roseoflavus]|nr:hypothetical protein J3R82DRAFT_3399 [Butyriboletus roseoflavus]